MRRPDRTIPRTTHSIRHRGRNWMSSRFCSRRRRAWNEGDIDGYMEGYKNSPETLFISRQVSKGFAEIVTEYKHDYPNKASMGTLSYSELEVHPLSDAFAVCHQPLSPGARQTRRRPGGRAVLADPREDSGWLEDRRRPHNLSERRGDYDGRQTVMISFSLALKSSSTRLISASVSC